MMKAFPHLTRSHKLTSVPQNNIGSEFCAEIGQRLNLIRTWLEYSPKEFAKAIGAPQKQVLEWEEGNSMIPPEIAVQICNIFGITTDYLYRGDELGIPRDFASHVMNKNIVF